MVTLFLQPRSRDVGATCVGACALTPHAKCQGDEAAELTLEGDEEPSIVVRTRMCESKIKGFALCAFKSLSAHGVWRHVQNAHRAKVAPCMAGSTRWRPKRCARVRCCTQGHYHG